MEFLRRLYNRSPSITSYRRNGTDEEKKNSDLVKELEDEISVFLMNGIPPEAILAAHAAKKSDGRKISYVIFNDVLLVEKKNTEGKTPCDAVNAIHYDYYARDLKEKIMIADAMYDGKDPVDCDNNFLKNGAKYLIEHYDMKEEDFRFM